MSFAKAYREADARQRHQPKDSRLEKLRRLMADDVSFVEAWYELNVAWIFGRGAASTIKALTFSLRNGVAALARPATVRRLAELSDTQMREVAVRLQKFGPHVAPVWTEKELQVLLAARNRVHGQDG
jgi:hypothetical protein